MRNLGIVVLCAALGGCVSTNETIAFRTSNPQQQAMMRDGQPALVSRQKHSLVLVRPAARQLQVNGRPVFVVGINNFGKQPTEFRVAQVEAIQHVGGSDFGMQIVTFEMLQQEEKNRQVAASRSHWRCRCRQCLQRVSRGPRKLYDTRRPLRHLLQPDSRRDRTEQRRRSKRSHVRRHHRNRTTQHGRA